MAKILKFWHQYSMFITIAGYIFLAGMTYKGNSDAIAKIQDTQEINASQHQSENLDHRVTILEQIASDNRQNFSDIKDAERAIFLRINQIADKQNGR